MNILREVRRVKQKSMPARIILLLAFGVIFIVTTYAWFSTQSDVNFTGLKGYTTSWDVNYYVNSDKNQVLDETAILTIDELYPGMPNRTDIIHIYNVGKASSTVRYDLVSVKIFGEEILDELDIQVDSATNTTTIFSGDTNYPFVITYTYDKTKLIGQYEENGEYASSAKATFAYNVSWAYEGNGTGAQNLEKDELDTQFGKDAYTYYQQEGSDPTKAIEVQVKITSSIVHPSVDPDYPYEYPYGDS